MIPRNCPLLINPHWFGGPIRPHSLVCSAGLDWQRQTHRRKGWLWLSCRCGEADPYRISDLGGRDHSVQPPAQAGSPGSGDTGTHPGGAGMSLEHPGRLHILPGQLFQGSATLNIKKLFLFNPWPCPCPVPGHHWAGPGTSCVPCHSQTQPGQFHRLGMQLFLVESLALSRGFFFLFNFQRGMEHDCCQSQPSTSSPPARLRRLRDSLGMPSSSVFLPRCPCTEPCRRSELARVRNGLGFNVCCRAHKHPLDSVLFLCFCSPAGQHESQGQQNASKLRILLEERKSSSFFFFSWQDGWGTRTGLVSPQTSPDIPSLRTWPGESC